MQAVPSAGGWLATLVTGLRADNRSALTPRAGTPAVAERVNAVAVSDKIRTGSGATRISVWMADRRESPMTFDASRYANFIAAATPSQSRLFPQCMGPRDDFDIIIVGSCIGGAFSLTT
jgi:hypothetical protein